MKKLFPILLILAIAVLGFFYMKSSPSSEPAASSGATPKQVAGDKSATPDHDSSSAPFEENFKPASEVYKSAELAFAALKTGATDYDDMVLEQFAELGDCEWCADLYSTLKKAIMDPTTSDDEKSYYSEVLAISGKLENIQALVEAIKNAPSPNIADIFSESLELTIGKDDTVSYLGTQMESDNKALKESAIAAVTNQGSHLAADLLYKEAVTSGNPDGHYSVGIGLGELVPDEETLPFLHELVLKRDEYSHLAVKALLNEGVNGLRIVFDSLEDSKNPEFDTKMLQDAIDHVSYDREVEDFAKKILETSRQEHAKKFAQQILDALQEEDQEEFLEEDEDTEAP